MDDVFLKSLLGFLVVILVFSLCRELVCWYFKLNKMSDTLDEIRDYLKAQTYKTLNDDIKSKDIDMK